MTLKLLLYTNFLYVEMFGIICVLWYTKFNTRATARCDRQNSIKAVAQILFSTLIFSIFSIIFTFKVSLINTVMQSILVITKLPGFNVHLQKIPFG